MIDRPASRPPFRTSMARLAGVLCGSALFLDPGALAGQDPMVEIIASAEYQALELSLDGAERWVRANAELERLTEEIPELAEDDEEEEFSVDGMVGVFDEYPAAREVLDKEGLSPREYVLTSLALSFTMGARMLREAGMEAPSLPAQHLEFFEEHHAELERLLGDAFEPGG